MLTTEEIENATLDEIEYAGFSTIFGIYIGTEGLQRAIEGSSVNALPAVGLGVPQLLVIAPLLLGLFPTIAIEKNIRLCHERPSRDEPNPLDRYSKSKLPFCCAHFLLAASHVIFYGILGLMLLPMLVTTINPFTLPAYIALGVSGSVMMALYLWHQQTVNLPPIYPEYRFSTFQNLMNLWPRQKAKYQSQQLSAPQQIYAFVKNAKLTLFPEPKRGISHHPENRLTKGV